MLDYEAREKITEIACFIDTVINQYGIAESERKNFMDALKKACDWLDEKHWSEWVLVNKALPKRDENVLCYCKNTSFDYQKVMWIDETTGEWVGFIGHFDEVVAWMPLPKPYEESEKI